VFCVYLISTVAGTFFSILDKITDLRGGDVITILATSIPGQSSYFVNYILSLAFTGYPLQLLRMDQLLLTWLQLLFLARSSREIEKAKEAEIFKYSVFYAKDLLVFVICMSYSSMSPFILPFGVLYYSLAWFTAKYNLLYVHPPHLKAGGPLFMHALNRIIVGLVISHVAVMVVLILKQFYYGLLLTLLTAGMLFYWFMLKYLYRKQIIHLALENCPDKVTENENITIFGRDGSILLELKTDWSIADFKNEYRHPGMLPLDESVEESIDNTASNNDIPHSRKSRSRTYSSRRRPGSAIFG